MTTAQDVLKKLTSRNTIALSTTGMMLFVIYTMVTTPNILIVTLAEHQEFIIGGAVVFGVFLAKWSDMIHFFFRRSGPSTPTDPIYPPENPTTPESTPTQ